MPITPGFVNPHGDLPLVDTLRPPPLGQHTICGGCYVLREDRTAVRLSELATSKPSSHWHHLLGPKGVQKVRVQIGAFGEQTNAIRMRDMNGQVVSFMTSLRALWASERHLIATMQGFVFNGLRVEEGELVHGHHLEVIGDREVHNYVHYSYTMTQSVIYIGAGKKPVFLPFEVS